MLGHIVNFSYFEKPKIHPNILENPKPIHPRAIRLLQHIRNKSAFLFYAFFKPLFGFSLLAKHNKIVYHPNPVFFKTFEIHLVILEVMLAHPCSTQNILAHPELP